MSADAQSILDSTTSQIDTYRSDAAAAITALASFRPSYFLPTAIDAPTLTSIADVAPATLASVPSFPTVAAATIGTVTPASFAATNPSDSPYTPLSADAIPAYKDATVDTSIAAQFAQTLAQSQSDLFTWLKGAVQSIVGSGGQNIASDVQDAAFNQGYNRLMQTTRDLLDLTGARTGAKGCRYANSMTKAQQNEIAVNLSWQRNDISREIIKQMADTAQRNLQVAIQAGVSIDDAAARVNMANLSALADVHRLTIEQYRADLQANLQEFERKIQLVLTDLGVQRADREEMRAFVSVEREQIAFENQANIATFDANTRAKLAKLQADTEIARYESANDVAVYDAENRAEFLRVETDKMIQDLKVQVNSQTLQEFAERVRQNVEIQRQMFADTQHQNEIALGALNGVANSYNEIVKTLSSQSVAIVKHNS